MCSYEKDVRNVENSQAQVGLYCRSLLARANQALIYISDFSKIPYTIDIYITAIFELVLLVVSLLFPCLGNKHSMTLSRNMRNTRILKVSYMR